MDTALVVGGKATADALGKILAPRYCAGVVHAPSASRARQMASLQEWGLVVVSAPLPDEPAATLARDLARRCGAGVLLLEEAPSQDDGQDGVIALQKPVNRILFEHTLRILALTQSHLAALREENRKLTLKLEETRLVGRAKCALVAYRQMTEEEAHRYIEKQAMDSRQPRRQVARDILQVFGE
jgi:response regulator NasT